jgi:anti-sigma factor RsiW
MMNHQPFETWLIDPTDLDPDQSLQLHQHLENCPDCRRIQTAWVDVRQLLETAPVQPAPTGFGLRFQASLATRRQQAHRRQVRNFSLLLGTSLLIAATLLFVQVMATKSIAEVIGSGVQFFTQAPQFWLDIRFIISFWAVEIPIGFWLIAGAALSGWTFILLISWFMTMIRISTQGVRNR